MTQAPAPTNSSQRRRMIAAALLVVGAGASWGAATYGVDWIERESAAVVRKALADQKLGWASVEADGLKIRLTGTAPDEVSRVNAVGAASAHVALSRIDDKITVSSADTVAPPAFRIEILRSDGASSVVGLAPASLNQEEMLTQLGKSGDRPSDLLEAADYPAPEGWDAALALGMTAAELAPRAKISVAPGQVEVTAVTDGEAEKTRLEDALRAATPAGVTLKTEISAPRPVIAPFVLSISRSEDATQMTDCTAGSDSASTRIGDVAKSVGVTAPVCAVGLGEPSPQWTDAAVAALGAVGALPEGTVTISDTEVSLQAPASVPEAEFAAARDALQKALPAAFSLTAEQAKPPTEVEDGPVSFVATATSSGVQLRGAVSDERMRAALESFATSRFGELDSALTVNAKAPSGWTARVLGVLRAMSRLERGSATVTPEAITISGHTGSEAAAEDLGEVLGRTLGVGVPYELSLTYDPRLDPATALPTGEQCVERVNEAMLRSKIGFESNRNSFAGDPAEMLDQIKTALRGCEDFRVEIGGHTDSQGSDSFNLDLSQKRAEAVLAAMKAAGIDAELLVAKGYGETQPIEDNGTDKGREANRRIEFRLLSPYPVGVELAPAKVVKAVTAAPVEEKAAAAPSSAIPMAERLPGTPPDLAGADSALRPVEPEASAPEAEAEAEGEAAEVVTADEIAAAEGIEIRPNEISASGDRITTPVPPPLIQLPGMPNLEIGPRRPPARPEN